jgi:hypothetical protein
MKVMALSSSPEPTRSKCLGSRNILWKAIWDCYCSWVNYLGENRIMAGNKNSLSIKGQGIG